MSQMLQIFIFLPLLGFIAATLVPHKKEGVLAGIALAVLGIQSLGILSFISYWAYLGTPILDYKQWVLYKNPHFEFFTNYYFDQVSAVFAAMGAILTFLVVVFSKYYMHREQGFKRFFVTLLAFYFGYNLIVFSGNFETLFIGWEILGITSFLLIGFYRDRYLPVKNGIKVLSFYRLGDICLILAMWMSHHLWHKNITFFELTQAEAVLKLFQEHYFEATFIALMIVIAAAIKSAQLPFFTWLPRAMEGPTSSSAIFYGSLSVHIGVFLLLRTYPFWGDQWWIKGIIIAIGLITSILAMLIARVQSSVKTQIAYASITQIGLMFIEVALGFEVLALFHFAGNAFLRTYQLLVSPSVLSYLIHDMFFNFKPRPTQVERPFWTKLRHGIYVLSIKEWNFDYQLSKFLWYPFKRFGTGVILLSKKGGLLLWLVLLLGAGAAYAFKAQVSGQTQNYLAIILAAIALTMVLKAFAERENALHAWQIALLSQLFTILSIVWNAPVEMKQILLYLSGTLIAAAVGYFALKRVRTLEGEVELNHYHGHSYEHPGMALLFLLSCLGLGGFPITPTFIAIDLMFTHISAHQIVLVFLIALNFLFLELTFLRMYTRIFLGQHQKAYHPIAFKSS
ncbi:MAG: proton-conducting transporter membrane subunit [Haliscomenobacter sp.]|uniref:proton-conducting transporter transmembrane domain-containing protein n=1 Tax=Haliscomenobacter sp. TaxID=2717303 RepID=UPI0029A01882|nr:proton-conducting transporter membrane subunit [Haliscomenobacter sp.]MDX2070822.1 proton-conducting transporter membrane subunit [Haliscomenobacter sp.]